MALMSDRSRVVVALKIGGQREAKVLPLFDAPVRQKVLLVRFSAGQALERKSLELTTCTGASSPESIVAR